MGFDEYNGREYSDMLNGGERIFCIATDDNHNKHADRTPDSDSFGGWTVIKADRLDYESVSAALEAGNFYASTGPEIYSLFFEDGKVSVTCSDAHYLENMRDAENQIELEELSAQCLVERLNTPLFV